MTTMWKTLHQLAAPPRLYQICGRLVPWLAAAGIIALATGWVRGFGFAPADYQQGEGYRIMYLHVPAAIWSMGIYAAMAVAAFTGLVWQMKMASLAVAAMAPVGAVYTFIALVTGAAWGKPMWGTWWVWDARLTSELVLLFLYAGVIALWHAFDDRKMAGRAAGILVLVGVVNLPVIHYSVEWWNTLHQGSTRMQQSIDPAMRSPLRWAIAGYLLLFMTLSLMRMRNLILLMEKRRPWVSELILKRGAPVSPAFSSWSDFFAMGGYAFFVWLAVAMTVAPLVLLALHTVLQRRAILRGVAQQRAREARMRAAQAQQEAA